MRSARCQFYIVQDKKGIPRLDDKYTIFGKLIKGMEIIDQIVHVQRDKADQPLVSITLDIDIKYLSTSKFQRLQSHKSYE